MKKLFSMFLVAVLLLGCNISQEKQENVNFESPQINEDDSYEYEHGVVNYKFERLSYNGESLSFDYFINNIRQECEFGLVFLVDGVCQTYEIEGQKTSMHKVKMKTNEKKVFSIKMVPEIAQNKELCNVNAFVILNPSTQIKNIKQYGHNHSISSTATMNLKLESNCASDKIQVKTLNTTYNDIPSDELKTFIKDGMNILKENVYIDYMTADENIDNTFYSNEPTYLRVFGKSGDYNVLVVEDNIITNMYRTSVKENKYSLMTLDLNIKNTKNIYFLIVPIDVQDVQDYIMIGQSERYIVK